MIKEKFDKKPLFGLIGISAIGLIGATFAYFTDSIEFPNVFKTKPYSTEAIETFNSPENWTPGTTTDKTVIARNTGDVDVAVRVSYTEEWKSANNSNLSLKQGEKTVSIINLSNTDDWISDGNYYYYKKKLSKNEETSTFIESVTFNEDVVGDYTCTTSNDGLKKSCTSTGNGYDNATYTLTIKVETVQFDAYRDAWGTKVTINND